MLKSEEAQREIGRQRDHEGIKCFIQPACKNLKTQKIELALITEKQIPKRIIVRVATESIETKLALGLLDIMVDSKLTFFELLRKATGKAATVTENTLFFRSTAGLHQDRGWRQKC